MSPSKERIDKFKEIFKKEYGKELSDEEAYESVNNLEALADLFYQIHKKEVDGNKNKIVKVRTKKQ